MDISIVVPLYNGSLYLEKLLSTIYMQTSNNLNFEVIIVDDCSTDDSRAVIQNYCRDHNINNLQLIKLDANRGTANARNIGVAAASGRWVQFLDSDDYLDSNYFSKIAMHLNDDNVDCLIYGVKYLKTDAIVTNIPKGTGDCRIIGYKNIVVNKLFKKAAIVDFDIKYSFEDVIWLVQMIDKQLNCKVINDLFYYVNRTNQNSKMANAKSNEWRKMALASIKMTRNAHKLTRAFVLEIFVGTIFARIFKPSHRLTVMIYALMYHARYLQFVIKDGIRSVDIKTIEYTKKRVSKNV